MSDYVGGTMGVWALFEEIIAFVTLPIPQKSQHWYVPRCPTASDRVA